MSVPLLPGLPGERCTPAGHGMVATGVISVSCRMAQQF